MTIGNDAQPPLRVVLIVGSVRAGRTAGPVAAWARDQLRHLLPGVVLDVVDLRNVELPDDDALRPGGSALTTVSATLAAADAYVVITPEYNHSIPAALKRLLDWHYAEWQRKAALVISYGVLGGVIAGEHLRAVLAELSVVVARRTVAIAAPWASVDGEGLAADKDRDAAMAAAVEEFRWWSSVLRTARREDPFVA